MSNSLKQLTCCPMLLKMVNDAEFSFTYVPRIATFTALYFNLAYRSEENKLSINNTLSYCLWCGTTFPDNDNLRNEWVRIIEQNYPNLNIYNDQEMAQLPTEFSSDEWWIKRKIILKYVKKISDLDLYKIQKKYSKTPEDEFFWKTRLEEETQRCKKFPYVCCYSLQCNMYGNEYCPKHKNTKIVCSDFPIIYKKESRSFYFTSVASTHLLHKSYEKEKQLYRVLLTQIFHCPWSGTKLPKNLAHEWFKIVTSEFGVTNIFNQKQLTKKLPPEFLTEEWWQQRGL